MGVRAFNRACYAIALGWTLAIGGLGTWIKERHPDIAQYYMGGAMALRERGVDLYPAPIEDGSKNAGFSDSSRLRPRYERIALEQRVAEFNRFVYTPPAALLFVPLALFDYPLARDLWIAAMSLCGFGVGLAAARVHARVRGQPTRLDGLLCIAVVASPLMFLTLRSGNITPLVALALAWAMLAVADDRPGSSALAMAVGGVFKGTSAVLLPLLVGLRRWRTLAALLAAAAAAVLAALLWMGAAPFRAFFLEIVPTFSRSTSSSANQSVAGVWLRLTGAAALPAAFGLALRAVAVVALVGATLLVARRASWMQRSPSATFAACAGLVALLLVLSPLVWAHYYLYLAPLWGWALAAGRRSRPDALLSFASIALTAIPVCVLEPGQGSAWEPLRSHMLAGGLCTLALAVRRLARPADAEASRPRAAGAE